MDHDVDFGSTSNNIWYSIRTLDESGNLVAANIGGSGSGPDARARSLAFINDANGLILQRDETDTTTSTGDQCEQLRLWAMAPCAQVHSQMTIFALLLA
jgi:hypothetical protein